MIVPMKKTTVITQHKDAQEAVGQLRKLGLLHVEHQKPPQSQDINILQEDAGLVNACLEVFGQAGCQANNVIAKTGLVDWKIKARHVVDLWKRYGHLGDFSNTLKHQINEWRKWGDFDLQRLQELQQKGIYLKFYQVPIRQLKEFPREVVIEQVFVTGGLAHCVAISTNKFEVPFKEVSLPKLSLSGMLAKLEEDEKTMQAIKNEICLAVSYVPELLEVKKKLEKEIEFQQALAGMGESRAVVYLTGYIPRECEGKILAEAKIKKWGILISDPQEDDNVPVLIRNPRWVSIISPVFRMLEIVPGYREMDISRLFLVFFGIFFGMLIGDSGYGLIYAAVTFWAQRKFGKKVSNKAMFFLFYVLSFCAIIWGLLTGTFFGQAWLLKAGYRPLIPALNDVKNIQAFCFFLGALHLTLAHSWQAAIKFPSLKALADIGWVCILWTAYFLANALILGDAFPGFGKWLVSCGISLVVLFTSPQKNLLKTIGSGLGTLALSLMNNFTDVVSYVRLFAVGLAGVAIADTFNSMAGGVVSANFFSLLLAGVIILAGHLLNLLLGPMSVLVHGVRLNVLEFSSHAGVSWSGTAYKPLKQD
ncbi:MAG: hypothetical protein WC532_03910 [Candidatus Omnitrophota bacterium]